MAASPISEVLQHLRRAVFPREGAGLTDGQLLGDYLRLREEAILDALVRRHGPMVWGVCCRMLRNGHDAEDAFQATFLVLIRKAASIAAPELLANWLYGVARQTALKARATAAKRRTRERQMAMMPEPATPEIEPGDHLQPLLDQELSRLPEKYRTAIVLCDLEQKTRKEAARQLAVPEGTVAARLARGRALLAKRLARHGLGVSAATLATVLSQSSASAQVPAALAVATVQMLTAVDASGTAVALADAVARGMAWNTVKTLILVLGLGVLISVGLAACPWGIEAATESVRDTSSAPVNAATASVVEKLQGIWIVTASEMDGVQDLDLGKTHTKLVFTGDRVIYGSHKGPLTGRFRLNTTRTPNEIDIVFDDGATLRGIYEFDGPRLRFCWTKGGQRPTSFDTATGELLTFLYTYEKQR